MLIRSGLTLMALTAAVLLAVTSTSSAQGKKSDQVVKATATTSKAAGKEIVSISLEIDPKWHLYANPVGNADFESNQTTVKITSKNKLESVKVDYPAGELAKDKVVGDYKIYKGKVMIKATVQRGKDDSGPLEVAIKVQACDEKSCLQPGTIKLSVP